MNKKLTIVISLFLLFTVIAADNLDESLQNEKRIKDKIVDLKYDKTIRPSVTVSILMDIALK